MSPSTAVRPHADAAAPWGSSVRRDLLAIVVAAALAAAITVWLVDAPARVPLTVVNDTDYELTVAVSSPGRDSWLPIVVIDPHQERVRSGTIDQGDEWVFRFAGQGRDGGEITTSRAQLADDGWRFEVPAEVAERLDAQGATPPPRSG